MKKLTQKLVLSVITMALVVVALGTSTFAWFTLTNSAEVGAFSAQVVAGTGIEVSLDSYSYYNGFDSEQMQDYLFDGGFRVYTSSTTSNTNAKYGTDFRFDAVTSKNGYQIINIDESVAANNTFIEFTLYFRSEEAITIKWTEVNISGEGKVWNPDASFLGSTGESVAIGTPYTVFAKNGARVSIFGDATADSEPNPTATIYELVGSTGDAGLSGNSTAFGDVTKGQAKYWEAKNFGMTYTTDFHAAPDTVAYAAALATIKDFSEVVPVLALEKNGVYYTGSIVVRVWLDGWDADTYNALFNDTLSVDLKFEKA